jgi:hypothetical protein
MKAAEDCDLDAAAGAASRISQGLTIRLAVHAAQLETGPASFRTPVPT